jgi:membrane fusion protein, multidrug efflux system
LPSPASTSSFPSLARPDGLGKVSREGGRRRVGVVLAGLLLALGVASVGVGAQAQAPGAAGGSPPPLSVSVLQVAPGKVPLILDAVGRTEGPRDIEVRARVGGILERKHFSEGAPVKAGSLMYQIDRAPYEIALEQARAALAQERVRLERARIEARRQKILIEERAISQREYDDAASNVLALEASMLAAEAKVHEAELNLSYTSVTAPIAGITGRTQRAEGSLVTVGSESALLTTITQTDPIWVRFSLSEPEFARLRNSGDRSGRVTLLTADGKPYERLGRLNFTSSVVDTRLGTVQMRAEFANPSLALLPGQFVKALVQAGQQDGVLVPKAAVFQGEQGAFVWVVGAENKAAPRPVKTGNWVGSDWVILDGLKAGDRVAVDNLIKLRPGMVVAPKPAATGATAGAAPAGAAPADKPASK